ncbi:hypothetical protein RRG08_039618 [Elysia crispata]|uniref:Uncharacterized protein n=1 Tax=Elysia crispata TaxID=231223 RepID=A0AAE0YA65_9GAST|nr:hypothetical protein RRG08_039618 [Elysia crispata]
MARGAVDEPSEWRQCWVACGHIQTTYDHRVDTSVFWTRVLHLIQNFNATPSPDIRTFRYKLLHLSRESGFDYHGFSGLIFLLRLDTFYAWTKIDVHLINLFDAKHGYLAQEEYLKEICSQPRGTKVACPTNHTQRPACRPRDNTTQGREVQCPWDLISIPLHLHYKCC